MRQLESLGLGCVSKQHLDASLDALGQTATTEALDGSAVPVTLTRQMADVVVGQILAGKTFSLYAQSEIVVSRPLALRVVLLKFLVPVRQVHLIGRGLHIHTQVLALNEGREPRMQVGPKLRLLLQLEQSRASRKRWDIATMLGVQQRWLCLALEDVSRLEDDTLATLLATKRYAAFAGSSSLPHHYVSQCGTLLKRVRLFPYLGVADVNASPKGQFKVAVDLASQFLRQVALLHGVKEPALQFIEHHRIGLELVCGTKHRCPRSVRGRQVLESSRRALVHHAPHLARVGRVGLADCREGSAANIASAHTGAVSLRGGRAPHALLAHSA